MQACILPKKNFRLPVGAAAVSDGVRRIFCVRPVAFFLAALLFFCHQNIMAQTGLLDDDFSTGNSYNWTASTSGASSELTGGQLIVHMALQSGGKYRGDIRKNGGVTVDVANYPIIAVRMQKPPRCNFFFDTNLGSYNGGNNNAIKIPLDSGNVYYWDLSTGTLGSTTLSKTDPTTLSLMQFKVADVELTSEQLAAGDTSYAVEWVKTFSSVSALRAAVGAPTYTPFSFNGSFTHPGLLHSLADLNRIKGFVDQQYGRPYQSYQLLLANSKSSASYNMAGPYEYLTRDPNQTVNGVAGGTVKNGVESDVLAAYYNALMWYISGDAAHAQKSVEILNAYADSTRGIIGSDAELNGLYGFMLANAAEIIRYTYSGWPANRVQACQDMLQSVFYPVLENFRPCAHGNWDIICMKGLMSIAIFSNDTAMFNHVVNYFYHGEGNGSIDNYVITDAGQLQESNRDQAHVMLALGSLAELSEMAEKQGLDLYGASDNAIMRGYEYTAKYNLGYDVPYQTSYDFCEMNYQDYTPESISDKARGQFRAVFEIAYNHYVYEKSRPMPYTLAVMAQMGPEGAPFGADNPGYGSLLFYKNDEPDHDFDTTGAHDGLIDDNFTYTSNGWIAATGGSTASVDSGRLKVSLVLQSNGKYRGDMKKENGAALYPANYHLLAIKINKPAVCNLIFDTNLGSYGNGANKWTGKLGDDIYYYDLDSTGFGSTPTFLSATTPTTLTTFQFKVADITSGETDYTVDWVKTVKSLDDLLPYDPATGYINDDFNDGADGWVAATGGSTASADSGQLRVSLVLQSNGKYRGDVRKTEGDTLYPANYPILAIKLKRPAVSNLTFDTNLGSYGNGSNKWTGTIGDSVYYYDLAQNGFGSGDSILTAPTILTTFQFKVADVTSGETNYTIDWVRTYKSLGDLENGMASGSERNSSQTGDSTGQGSRLPEWTGSKASVYPNPARAGSFFIRLDPALSGKEVEVKLYTIDGKIIFDKLFRPGGSSRITVNPGKSVATGLYMVRVNREPAIPLIIQR